MSYVKSEEIVFNTKLKELNLRANCKEEEKADYGVTLHRLIIKIYNEKNKLLATASSGFKTKLTYRENAYIEGNRRLMTIEMNGEHKS